MYRAGVRDKHYEEHRRKIHKKKLESMQPAIDNDAPDTFSHLESRKKWIQMESDRLSHIERENLRLAKRMEEIASKPSKLDHVNGGLHYKKSLNLESRIREQERIRSDNYDFVKRMIENPPQYSVQNWGEERAKQIQYMKYKAEYPLLSHHTKPLKVVKSSKQQDRLEKAKKVFLRDVAKLETIKPQSMKDSALRGPSRTPSPPRKSRDSADEGKGEESEKKENGFNLSESEGEEEDK